MGDYGCIAEALKELCPHLKNKKMGAVGVVNNPKRQKYGYQWRTDFTIPVYDISNECLIHNKGVCQLSLTGEVIATYNSMKECLIAINKTNSSRIKRCCDGVQDTYLGYRWAWL